MIKKIVDFVDVGDDDKHQIQISTTWYFFGIPFWNKITAISSGVYGELKRSLGIDVC